METLVLASASPRRRELLSMAGIPFETDSANVDEQCELPAEDAVRLLSERKALSVCPNHPGRYILAADTLVELDGIPLGKPESEQDAVRMLHALSGRTHRVHTGICLINPGGERFHASDTSLVTFCNLSDAEIDAYVRSGEPMDKAGAYAIQGRPALWVTRLEGSWTSVVGLPLHLVRTVLLESGYTLSPAL